MPIKQNPFSLYDFLGYLIPGALLIYAILGMNELFFQHSTLRQLFDFLHSPKGILPLTIISYIAGHMIGIISSNFIEKSYISRFGYPSAQLLPADPECSDARLVKNGKKSSQYRFFPVLLNPIIASELIIAKLKLGDMKCKEFDKRISMMMKEKIIYYFSKAHHCNDAENILSSEYFHHIYHYCVEHSPAHLPKIQNYVALYGLFRNTALVLLITFWFLLLESAISATTALFIKHQIPNFDLAKLFYIVFAFLCFSVLYLGFAKFYRRYSSEVFLAFCVTYQYEIPRPRGRFGHRQQAK